MEKGEIEADNNLAPLPFLSSVVAVAIDGHRKSKYVVKWALEKFVPEGKVIFKLIHVRPRITGVPTPSKQCALTFICSNLGRKWKFFFSIDYVTLPLHPLTINALEIPVIICLSIDLID